MNGAGCYFADKWDKADRYGHRYSRLATELKADGRFIYYNEIPTKWLENDGEPEENYPPSCVVILVRSWGWLLAASSATIALELALELGGEIGFGPGGAEGVVSMATGCAFQRELFFHFVFPVCCRGSPELGGSPLAARTPPGGSVPGTHHKEVRTFFLGSEAQSRASRLQKASPAQCASR